MKCPVCNIATDKRTCSMQCAGKLAYSIREANKERRKYDNPEKQKIRECLFKVIKNQHFNVKNHSCGVQILDFWGGGLFSDYILDHPVSVKNHLFGVLYEIDSNPKLYPALRDYANRKNHLCTVKNQPGLVPFCGSLAKFVQAGVVKNHHVFDFIWLDYTGTFKQLRQDIEQVKKLCDNDTVLAITLFCGRDNMIDVANRHKNVDSMVADYLPLHKNTYAKTYSNMAIYVYRVDSKLKKMKFFRKEEYEESTRDCGTTPPINSLIC